MFHVHMADAVEPCPLGIVWLFPSPQSSCGYRELLAHSFSVAIYYSDFH